jgi:hypothetical protein
MTNTQKRWVRTIPVMSRTRDGQVFGTDAAKNSKSKMCAEEHSRRNYGRQYFVIRFEISLLSVYIPI